jgi:hypothetical protein
MARRKPRDWVRIAEQLSCAQAAAQAQLAVLNRTPEKRSRALAMAKIRVAKAKRLAAQRKNVWLRRTSWP